MAGEIGSSGLSRAGLARQTECWRPPAGIFRLELAPAAAAEWRIMKIAHCQFESWCGKFDRNLERFEAGLVQYVPAAVSGENRLLVAAVADAAAAKA